MKNEYYTLLDKRDRTFKMYATVEEIANYLIMYDVLDIYEIDEKLKEYNNGQAGYYIYELNRG